MDVDLKDIKRLISLQLGLTELADDDHFLEELHVASMDVMNIIVAVEQKYQIEIAESEIPGVTTPLALYQLVRSKSADDPA